MPFKSHHTPRATAPSYFRVSQDTLIPLCLGCSANCSSLTITCFVAQNLKPSFDTAQSRLITVYENATVGKSLFSFVSFS